MNCSELLWNMGQNALGALCPTVTLCIYVYICMCMYMCVYVNMYIYINTSLHFWHAIVMYNPHECVFNCYIDCCKNRMHTNASVMHGYRERIRIKGDT